MDWSPSRRSFVRWCCPTRPGIGRIRRVVVNPVTGVGESWDRDSRVLQQGDMVTLPGPGGLVRVGSDMEQITVQQGASPCDHVREQRDQFAARPPSLGAGRPRRPAARGGRGDFADARADLTYPAGAQRRKEHARRPGLAVRTPEAAAPLAVRQPLAPQHQGLWHQGLFRRRPAFRRPHRPGAALRSLRPSSPRHGAATRCAPRARAPHPSAPRPRPAA